MVGLHGSPNAARLENGVTTDLTLGSLQRQQRSGTWLHDCKIPVRITMEWSTSSQKKLHESVPELPAGMLLKSTSLAAAR